MQREKRWPFLQESACALMAPGQSGRRSPSILYHKKQEKTDELQLREDTRGVHSRTKFKGGSSCLNPTKNWAES